MPEKDNLSKSKDENIHKGHRKRLKDKVINSGLDSLADHEVIELLLFYCIPMKDTNELAHKVLKEFGSIHNLFDARVEDIVRKCGVTEHIAILFSIMPHLYKRYTLTKWEKQQKINSSRVAGEYCQSLFIGENNECFYIVCLNSQSKLITSELVSKGTVDETQIYPRHIVEIALKHKASTIIITHNHPSGILTPSKNDVDATNLIINALKPISINVSDHIIVGGGGYYSFSEKKLLSLIY